MKSQLFCLLILSVLSFTACYPGEVSTQSFTQTASPHTTTIVPSTNTEAPPSPTHTRTLIPTHTIAPSRTPTQTSTSTPITPTAAPTSTDDPFANRLLPDLQTLPPKDLRLLYDPESGRAIIRFTNSILNSGPGNLELIGIRNQAKDRILVSQRVYGTEPEVFDEYEVGEFIFSDDHNHWHLERFALYEVWSVGEGGSLESLLSSGEKVSWCVIDETLAGTELPGETISIRPNYSHCESEIQGLSMGWVDIYESYLPRQWVEIPSLKDGLYALVSTANPDHLIYEANFLNNTGLIYFEIQELRLKIIEKLF